MWKPWASAKENDDNVISVTGEATVKAEPDEYTFSPNYQFKNNDKDVALAELTKKSDEIIAKLKELGVNDNKIKSNSSGFGDYYPYYYDEMARQTSYTLSLTVTTNNREQAQKIQDYLVSTSPTGAVSPQATFSEAKRKEVEGKARDEATKDARAKADQSAKNLGFKVGRVKAVNDSAGFGDIYPMKGGSVALDVESPETRQLSVQPGENELSYSVTVTYFVR